MQRSFVRLAATTLQRQKLIEKVLRVDHAGELGADRIYAGQMAVLSGNPISSVIKRMWDEEKEHLQIVERLIAKHDVPSTIFAPVFSVVAFALGATTALIGKEAAMACTVAVEELISQHYNNQIKELIEDDPHVHGELLKILSRLRDEEMEHHDTGVANDGTKVQGYDALKWIIQSGCKGAIWLSERI